MRLTRFDAWVLARLLSGLSVADDELAAMSATNRPLAERLAATPPEGRQALWDVFLIDRANADAVIKALADAGPAGPAPALDADPAESDWPPLSLEASPPVEPFPVDVLPDPAARLVIEGADAIGCPPDFLGVPMLAVAGGTIGRSVSLRLKPGYFASAVVFAACVGPPSDGKTPALKAVADAVRSIDDGLAAEHAQAIERWKQEAAGLPEGSSRRPAPKPRRIDIDDATMEVLPIILADNPRGLIMIRDELTRLRSRAESVQAGGKGNDRGKPAQDLVRGSDRQGSGQP